jgi:hypothetical protein
MTRGKIPDIPARQKLGVRSLGAHEQDARRDYRIQHQAWKLAISRRSLEEHPTVRRYVSVLRDADAARERLGMKWATEFIQEVDPVAYQRVGQASVLYEAEGLILEEGFQGHSFEKDPDFVRSITPRLRTAVEPFGLSVSVPEGWSARRLRDITEGRALFRSTPEPVGGVWTDTVTGNDRPLDPWDRVDGDNRFWDLPDWPSERHDPEHLRVLAAEAGVQGVDPRRPRTDPMMHTLLTGIVHGRELVRATEDLDGLPPAPGMTPPAQERLRRVAPLNRLAVGVLEDAVRPGSMTQERVVVELTPVLETYDLRFVA